MLSTIQVTRPLAFVEKSALDWTVSCFRSCRTGRKDRIALLAGVIGIDTIASGAMVVQA